MHSLLTLKVFLSLFLSASYKQKGSSMVVHSFMNSMEPPGSAEISQMAMSLCGRLGDPMLLGSQGAWFGVRRDLASGMVNRRGVSGDQ